MIINFEHLVIHDSNCWNDSAVRQDMKLLLLFLNRVIYESGNQFNADT